MTVQNIIAANAYAKNQGIGAGMGTENIAATGDQKVNFSDFLEEKVQNTVDTVKRSEQLSAKAITGEASITDVVQAITEADMTITTAKAIIDRMLSAYQEIMRLPI